MTRRWLATGLLVIYVVGLATIVFWPTSEAPAAAVSWIQAWIEQQGGPAWATVPRVEFLANVALFVPLTFLGVLAVRRGGWLAWSLAGAVTSALVELGQAVALPDRAPTAKDVVANALGSLIGALVAIGLRRIRSNRKAAIETNRGATSAHFGRVSGPKRDA